MEYVLIAIGVIIVAGLTYYWLNRGEDEPERIEPMPDSGSEDTDESPSEEESTEVPVDDLSELGLDKYIEQILRDQGLEDPEDILSHDDLTSIHGIGPARQKKIFEAIEDSVKDA